MIKFIFDLDGTLTKEETLPRMANHFQLHVQMEELTQKTISGEIPFEESFLHRVEMLKHIDIKSIATLLSSVEMFPDIVAFIQENKEHCMIATGNLSCWIDRLCKKLDCPIYSSEALTENNKVKQVTKIINKEAIVKKYQQDGNKVIFIGDGANDRYAMKQADISIASALVHSPPLSVIDSADYLVHTEKDLHSLLNNLLHN